MIITNSSDMLVNAWNIAMKRMSLLTRWSPYLLVSWPSDPPKWSRHRHPWIADILVIEYRDDNCESDRPWDLRYHRQDRDAPYRCWTMIIFTFPAYKMTFHPSISDIETGVGRNFRWKHLVVMISHFYIFNNENILKKYIIFKYLGISGMGMLDFKLNMNEQLIFCLICTTLLFTYYLMR